MPPLNPDIARLIALSAAAGTAPEHTQSVALARERFAGRIAALPTRRPPPLAAVEDRRIRGPDGAPDLPVRLYRPRTDATLPVLVFFHGGGFVIGSIDTHDETCRHLAHRTDCIVASIGYRLAPEHPYPAAVDDGLAAARWAASEAGSFGGDPARIGLCGDSAGGALAAITALRLRDEGGLMPRALAMLYPVTDHPRRPTASQREFRSGYGLNLDSLLWFWDLYLPAGADDAAPHVSPLRAPSLAGMPPTLVVTAEYDILRDEAERFGERLSEDGVDAAVRRYPGMVHGFVGLLGMVGGVDAALDEICAWVRLHLAPPDRAGGEASPRTPRK